jgi:CheY-like chemotaxis protein
MTRVLIVEDDPIMKDALAVLFEGEGYTVQTASNGRLAVELLQESGSLPDVFVVDLMMPVMDGFGFLEAVRQHPIWSERPTVVITGTDAQDVSATAVLRKPLSFERLLTVIRDLRRDPLPRVQ